MVWAWLSLLVRSGLILAAAELFRRLSPRAHAEYRHRILCAGFALLLIWPAISAVLPQIPLPVWTHETNALVTVAQTARFRSTPSPAHVTHFNWPFSIWVFGVLVTIWPLALGHLKMLRMLAKASKLCQEDWRADLLEECSRSGIRRCPELLVWNGPVVPLVCGVLRPRILLPTECLEWQPLRRRAVLVHELTHIRRYDLVWQTLANLATALWWFQPLCWVARRSLRQESEQACDAWVVSSGIRASDYATELLNIAQRFSYGQSAARAATAMAGRGDLGPRLQAILDPRPRLCQQFPSIKVLMLLVVTLAASAVTLLPQQSDLRGGHPMKRTVISGLLTSAGLTAATIGGSVFDPSGAAVANAQAFIYNPDTGLKQEAATTADGKFTFQSLPAGSYILRVDKPGFASLYREFNVKPDSEVDCGLVLNAAPAAANSDALEPLAESLQRKEQASAGQAEPGTTLLRVAGTVAQANLVTKIQPVYPAAAKAAGVQGTVELDVAISKDGVPEDIRVVRSPSDDLTQSALESVRQWRYRSTLLNGQPVAIVTNVIVNYTLVK